MSKNKLITHNKIITTEEIEYLEGLLVYRESVLFYKWGETSKETKELKLIKHLLKKIKTFKS